MPRHRRNKSQSGIFHIMLRGINKQDIFEDNEDKQKLLETIKHYKMVSGYDIYGYCLMNNHVHLLIRETIEPLSLVIKRISSSYVYWYNRKYGRCGHLFQERFKSEIVEDDRYFITVLRYIHQNPVKAGLTKNVAEYKWSSYSEFVEKVIMVDVNFVLKMFAGDMNKALGILEAYMNELNDDKCLEYKERKIASDDEVREYFFTLGISHISQLQQSEKLKRDQMIKQIKSMDGVTIRQLARITGISKSVIDRI